MDTLRRKLKSQRLDYDGDSASGFFGDERKARPSALSMNDNSTIGEIRGNRAPDPTQGKHGWTGRKGVSTVNVKRKGDKSPHRSKRFDPTEVFGGPPSRQSMSLRDVMGKTLKRKKVKRVSLTNDEFGKEPERRSTKSIVEEKGDTREEEPPIVKQNTLSRKPNSGKVAKSNSSLDPNLSAHLTGKSSKKRTIIHAPDSQTPARKVSDTTSDSQLFRSKSRSGRKTRIPSMKGTLPRKMKTYLAGLYKNRLTLSNGKAESQTESQGHSEENDSEARPFSALGSDDLRFKQAMLEKYQSMSGSLGAFGVRQEGNSGYGRKDSSFSMENPMVLLLGKSKAGKSTFFKQLMAMAGAPPNYARAYVPTRMPVEKDVTIEDTEMVIVDVGGSKADVVDWRFYLTTAEVIVYMVALDEYDKVVVQKEGETKTALQESLDLFDSIVNNVALLNSKFVLIFNKADRFKKKISDKKISLSDVGAYQSPPTSCDYDDCLRYIEDMFMMKAELSEHEVQVEVTSAIDAESSADVLSRLTQRLVRSKDVTKWKNLL